MKQEFLIKKFTGELQRHEYHIDGKVASWALGTYDMKTNAFGLIWICTPPDKMHKGYAMELLKKMQGKLDVIYTEHDTSTEAGIGICIKAGFKIKHITNRQKTNSMTMLMWFKPTPNVSNLKEAIKSAKTVKPKDYINSNYTVNNDDGVSVDPE